MNLTEDRFFFLGGVGGGGEGELTQLYVKELS